MLLSLQRQQRRLHDEINQLFKTAFPTWLNLMVSRLPWLISLRFVGVMGADELAAAALSSTLFNVMALSIAEGLTSALATLTGQARGDLLVVFNNNNNKKKQQQQQQQETTHLLQGQDAQQIYTNKIGNRSDVESNKNKNKNNNNNKLFLPVMYLFQGLLVQMLFALPLCVWWLSAGAMKSFLVSMGQEPLVAAMTESYLRRLTPGIIGDSVFFALTTWLQSMEMADVGAVASFLGFVLHIPINVLFIRVFGWGYLGCAAATSVNQLVQPLYVVVYVFFTKQGRMRLLTNMHCTDTTTTTTTTTTTSLSFWSEARASLNIRGIMVYLGMALPGVVLVSEWWASECLVLLSGKLQPSPEIALSAMTIYQSINISCSLSAVAFSVAVAARVGNLLGAQQPNNARFAAYTSLGLVLLTSGLVGTALYILPHETLPSLFAPNQTRVVKETAGTMPLLAIYVVADGLQLAFSGIATGCGRQLVTMPVVVVAYWFIGVPLAYFRVFVEHHGIMEEACESSSTTLWCGTRGLVSGALTGTISHVFLLAVVVLTTTVWEREAKRATARLSNHGDTSL